MSSALTPVGGLTSAVNSFFAVVARCHDVGIDRLNGEHSRGAYETVLGSRALASHWSRSTPAAVVGGGVDAHADAKETMPTATGPLRAFFMVDTSAVHAKQERFTDEAS